MVRNNHHDENLESLPPKQAGYYFDNTALRQSEDDDRIPISDRITVSTMKLCGPDVSVAGSEHRMISRADLVAMPQVNTLQQDTNHVSLPVYATVHRPRNRHVHPRGLFNHGNGWGVDRITLTVDEERQMLIYTDGSCIDQGTQPNYMRRAGCAFMFATDRMPWDFELERRGPTGRIFTPTSNRAELRAALAALDYRDWRLEGWDRVVIATDSQYLVNGITDWCEDWQRRGWRTATGRAVLIVDLWKALLLSIREHHNNGLEISFWWIPRALNADADQAARDAAERNNVPEYFTRVE